MIYYIVYYTSTSILSNTLHNPKLMQHQHKHFLGVIICGLLHILKTKTIYYYNPLYPRRGTEILAACFEYVLNKSQQFLCVYFKTELSNRTQ